ncbi:MAG: pilus assembly protein [Clostridiaceae bacterium]|nr:pilus assembly protein [Clostridiaceae bacterium]
MCFNFRKTRGNFTVEYAILLPVIFAAIIFSIVVFLIFYQGALLQNTAENLAESLARQWNYAFLNRQEINSGVYQKSSFDEREVYWDIKIWKNRSKENSAQKYCQEYVEKLGFFRFYESNNSQVKPKVQVKYSTGIPSKVKVKIDASYVFPGSEIMRVLGLGNVLKIKAEAQCNVYNAKDMINTTDYIFQMLRETKIYALLDKRFQDIKNSIDKVIR